MFDKIGLAWHLWGWFSDHFLEIVGGITSILGGAAVIAAIIPGEHPDKEIAALQAFVAKYSRKKKDAD